MHIENNIYDNESLGKGFVESLWFISKVLIQRELKEGLTLGFSD